MRCDLTDEEDAALARLLSDTINDDRYPLLARIRAFEEDPRQDPAGAVTCTTAAPIRPREPVGPTKRRIRRDYGNSTFLGVKRSGSSIENWAGPAHGAVHSSSMNCGQHRRDAFNIEKSK